MPRRKYQPIPEPTPNPFPDTTGQTEKLADSGIHNRTLNFKLANGEILQIQINYTGVSNGNCGFYLDGEVIPFIQRACNSTKTTGIHPTLANI